MIKKRCWKCSKISEFNESKLPYVIQKTGGSQHTCISCVEKFMKENNIKKIKRIETPDSLFSCRFEYEYNT